MSLSKPTYHKIASDADDFLAEIHQACQTLSLAVTEAQAYQLLGYLDQLLLWTKAYNLTAITAPKAALIKHIFDALAVLWVFDRALSEKINPSILDIGTGAGLPAVVFAIMRKDWQITALDSNGKKIRFIRQIASDLHLNNLTPVASRIEDFEGTFEVITSRAFASLDDFVRLGRPLLASKGVFLAMKGKALEAQRFVSDEFDVNIHPIFVPMLDEERCVVALEPKNTKESQ